MSIEVTPVLPVPKFTPGKIVEYQRPDGGRTRVRIVVAMIQVNDSDLDAFQVSYMCEWGLFDDSIQRLVLPEYSLKHLDVRAARDEDDPE